MKKLLLSVSLLFAFIISVISQSPSKKVWTDNTGTKYEVKTSNSVNSEKATTTGKKIIKANNTTESKEPEETGYIYEDKEGTQYQIFKGPRGGLFYWKYSERTGKKEKRYIKVN